MSGGIIVNLMKPKLLGLTRNLVALFDFHCTLSYVSVNYLFVYR